MNKGGATSERICITGLGVISSVGIGTEAFLHSLKAGRSGVGDVRTFDTAGFPSRKAAEVKDFHPRDFIPAGKIRRLDRASQFAIAASRLALADACFGVTEENSPRVGIVLGSGFCGLSASEEFHRSQVLREFVDLNPMLFPNTVPNGPASHTSIELGLRGVNCTLVQSFCSAEAAFVFACDQIRNGRAELILTGGVDELSEFLFRGFSALGLLATDRGDGELSCPYDRRRNGLVLGEGAGILAVESEAHARSRGARIYGYILDYNLIGSSINRDDGKDLARSIRLTLREKGSRVVDYMSGAGNSSRRLDVAECCGVKNAYPDRALCVPVSSIKSMIGEGVASGGQRMVADVLSMTHGFVPPTVNCLFPDPDCDLPYAVRALDREILTLLHLAMSPGECFSSILVGAEWS